MAASRLRNALNRGRVTPEQAQEAMRGGEGAVATLLLPHLYQCSIDDAVPPTPVGNTTYVSPQDLANLSPLLMEMQAAGTITERDWASANQSSAGKTILDLVMLGTRRIVDAAAAKLPATMNDYSPFNLAPLALARLIHGQEGEGWEVTATCGKVLVSNAETPFVTFPDPESDDELQAICCLIEAINVRAGTWFAVPPDDALYIIDCMLAELLSDVRTHVPEGPASTDLPNEVLDTVLEYYGCEVDDSDSVDEAISRLNDDLNSYIPARKWKMGDGKLESFLSSPTGPNAGLIRKLFDLYQNLEKHKGFDNREVVEGDYFTCDLFIVPVGFWNNYYERIQQYGYEYCPSEVLSIEKSARTKRPHLKALELGVMATSVATTIARIIIDESPN